ncbi:endonuclease domain-containing protein [Tsukamurella sp. 1534]|uniref:endonuclease domain-containing protein n=1 Tax=Tsukamurella sp. 1534 TaxID=1151061 RepID=UPI0002EA8205|nr:DUF559 domain-containing protein [Tsukamurella sp. 1534]
MQERTRSLRTEFTAHDVRTRFTQVIHGVRRDGAGEVTVRDRYDALAEVYPDAVFIGWSAAGLHGVPYSVGHPPEIWLPTQRRRTGVVIRTGRLPDEDVVPVLGRRATTGVRTAVDLARTVRGDHAVAALDQCLHLDAFGRSVTTLEEVRTYLNGHPGLHRGARARRVLREAAVGADSPWETFTRLVVHRAGLRMFQPQTPIEGTPFHVDLGSREHRVAVEYDGKPHRDSRQHDRDAERLNAIVEAGWSVVLVTAGQLLHKRERLLAGIAQRLTDRGWSGRPPSIPRLEL